MSKKETKPVQDATNETQLATDEMTAEAEAEFANGKGDDENE